MRASLIKKFFLYLLLNYENAFVKNEPIRSVKNEPIRSVKNKQMDLLKNSKCNQKKNKRLNKENVYIIIHHYIYYI